MTIFTKNRTKTHPVRFSRQGRRLFFKTLGGGGRRLFLSALKAGDVQGLASHARHGEQRHFHSAAGRAQPHRYV